MNELAKAIEHFKKTVFKEAIEPWAITFLNWLNKILNKLLNYMRR